LGFFCWWCLVADKIDMMVTIKYQLLGIDVTCAEFIVRWPSDQETCLIKQTDNNNNWESQVSTTVISQGVCGGLECFDTNFARKNAYFTAEYVLFIEKCCFSYSSRVHLRWMDFLISDFIRYSTDLLQT
jgi:hypothetical protein